MASLFIRDDETARLAGKVAAQLRTTKTDAVRRALKGIDTGDTTVSDGSTADWLRAYRAVRPLPDRERMKADKAFYDSLSDEDTIFDPWAS